MAETSERGTPHPRIFSPNGCRKPQLGWSKSGASRFLHVSHVVAKAQILGPSSLVSPGALAGLWFRSGVARICASASCGNLAHYTSPRSSLLSLLTSSSAELDGRSEKPHTVQFHLLLQFCISGGEVRYKFCNFLSRKKY